MNRRWLRREIRRVQGMHPRCAGGGGRALVRALKVQMEQVEEFPACAADALRYGRDSIEFGLMARGALLERLALAERTSPGGLNRKDRRRLEREERRRSRGGVVLP